MSKRNGSSYPTSSYWGTRVGHSTKPSNRSMFDNLDMDAVELAEQDQSALDDERYAAMMENEHNYLSAYRDVTHTKPTKLDTFGKPEYTRTAERKRNSKPIVSRHSQKPTTYNRDYRHSQPAAPTKSTGKQSVQAYNGANSQYKTTYSNDPYHRGPVTMPRTASKKPNYQASKRNNSLDQTTLYRMGEAPPATLRYVSKSQRFHLSD